VLFPSEDTFPLIANVHKDGYFELLSSVRSVILVDIPLTQGITKEEAGILAKKLSEAFRFVVGEKREVVDNLNIETKFGFGTINHISKKIC